MKRRRGCNDMDVSLFDKMTADFLMRPPAWIVEDSHRNKPPLTSAPHASRSCWSARNRP